MWLSVLILLLQEKILKFITNHNSASSFRFAQTNERKQRQLSLARQILRESAIFEQHSRFSRYRHHISISQIDSRSFFKMSSDKNEEYKLLPNQCSIPIKVPGASFNQLSMEDLEVTTHEVQSWMRKKWMKQA